jgi:hypothetical protein
MRAEVMIVMTLAWIAALWLGAGPWIALATGTRRGHMLAGWLCGLVPFAGPFIALRVIPLRIANSVPPQS